MDIWKEFHGPNAGYLLELYERFQNDPGSVDENWRAFFDQWQPAEESKLDFTRGDSQKIIAAANLANAIRTYGHLAAQLDPLGSSPPGDPSLVPASYGLSEEDLRGLPVSVVGGPVCINCDDAYRSIQGLRKVYCSSIGYDYGHIRVPEEREWLRDAAESGRYRPPNFQLDRVSLLERLTQVEVFEHFLHRIYPGKTRFSIEGLDMMVPILDQIVAQAAENEICMIFIGMAHRGRLNVLAHNMQKPYAQILAEFKDPKGKFTPWNELGWTGDVKYHKGASGAVMGGEEIRLVVCMPPNPSHLEHINPVLEGMARAADTAVDRPGPPRFFPKASLPVLIHGDAAFPGQGIVAETLNLSRLAGYRTAGTIHIIANNRIGFTTNEDETRSTLYASDLAKGFKIPVIHVNADDPEACIEAAQTAFAYRTRFHGDFLIDLIGYRRYGHNEGDEPSFTQPQMYRQIRNHPSVREIWAKQLVEQKQIDSDRPEDLYQRGMEALRQANEQLKAEESLEEPYPVVPKPGAARQVKTAVTLKRLKELNRSLLEFPPDLTLNSKLEKGFRQRGQSLDQPDQASIDWTTAEELAFASILEEGIPIRLTGEDVARGTFSQRHDILFDVENERSYIPLQSLPQAKASYEVINSPLSENAAIGFEFGINVLAPERLIVWEAQYGDFINTAQPILDEFVISARAKWGQKPSLVLLLPHGNEGQGPDHSSARLERFLKLSEEGNLRIANPTTAAQYFHLLRRQALLLKTDPLPLVVLTPKGLLRHPLTASSPRDLAEGRWSPVLDDPDRRDDPDRVQRLLLCNGRIYADLINSPYRSDSDDLAIVRIEQLHSFPAEELSGILKQYSGLKAIAWIQEEPRNMGAWDYVSLRLRELLDERLTLTYFGRPPSSSPAEGSTAWYSANQQNLVKAAYQEWDKAIKNGVRMQKG